MLTPSGGDDTANFDAAFAVCRTSGGGEILVAAGQYVVSSIDATYCHSTILRALGAPGSVVIYGANQTTPAPILDCAHANSITIDGVVTSGNQGGSPWPVTPMVGILLADTNKSRLRNVGTTGSFGAAGVAVIGGTNMAYDSIALQQDALDKPTIVLSTNKDWGVDSPHSPLSESYSNIEGQAFIGQCEFHGTKSSGATNWTFYARNLAHCWMDIPTFDSSGEGQILLEGTCDRIRISMAKYYTESGHLPRWIWRMTGSVGYFEDQPRMFVNGGHSESSPWYPGSSIPVNWQ